MEVDMQKLTRKKQHGALGGVQCIDTVSFNILDIF